MSSYPTKSQQLVDGHRHTLADARHVDAELLGRVCDGLEQSFGTWPAIQLEGTPADYLRWKLEKPDAVPPLLGVIERAEDDELVAAQVLLPRWFRLLGSRRPASDFCDTAVLPQFQGQGYYRRQRELSGPLDAHFDFVIWSSRNPRISNATPLTSEHATDAPANAIKTLLRPLHLSRLEPAGPMVGRPAALIVRWGIALISWWSRARHRSSRTEDRTVRVRAVTRFDERFDELCVQATAEFDFAQERGVAYLNWRYADARAGEFKIFVAEHEEDLLGYAVLAPRGDRLSIADLLVRPGRSGAVTALVQQAILDGQGRRSAAVTCWLPQSHPYRAVLQSEGFVDIGSRSGIEIRSIELSAGEKELLFRNPRCAIHFMQGDLDVV